MSFKLSSLFSGKKWFTLGLIFFLIRKFKNTMEIDFKPYLHAIKVLVIFWIFLILLGLTAWLTFIGALLLWLHVIMNQWLLPFLTIFIIQLILLLIVKLVASKQLKSLRRLLKQII